MRVLLLQVGHTYAEIAARRGDYEAWFRAGLSLTERELVVLPLCDGASLPDDYDYDALVVTGSAAMVTDREPWSEATGRYLLGALEAERPLLAVCYGHQLLAHALGGLVGYNPRGRHVGSAEVALTPEAATDPLFGSLPTPLLVQVSHSQVVLDLPAEATRMGHTLLDPNHAYRVGSCAWGVQFHPEFDADIVRGYIDVRAATIAAEGLDPEALRSRVRESDHGPRLLRRFRALLG